jgi:hypothetical protein
MLKQLFGTPRKRPEQPVDATRGPLPTTCAIDGLYASAPPAVFGVHGQISLYDRLLYYWAGKDFYSGAGSIVDGGVLVGGTTACFGEGLLANRLCAPADGVVHVYDLFTDARDGFSALAIKNWYGETGNAAEVYDFERHFRRNVAPYERYLTVHKGDITAFGYRDSRPIEILSIDVAKTPALMHYMATEFFPHLIAGHSLVLHQDYIFTFQPWLLIAMEMMSELIEKVYVVPTQCTACFRPRRPIRKEDVERLLGSDPTAYFSLENVGYIYAAIEKSETWIERVLMTAALAYFYHFKRETETARFIAGNMIDQFGLSASFIERTELKTLFAAELGIDYRARTGEKR